MKNKFFSSLSVKLALAVVALSALTFTSCDKEPFDVKIIYNPAKVTITPAVQYIDMAAGTAQDVTSSATITFSGATSTGVIEGTTTNPSIAAGVVNITATYNGLTGTTSVQTPALQTGVVNMTPTIFIIKTGTPVGPGQVVFVVGIPTLISEAEGTPIYLTPSSHIYNHAGRSYIENATDYFMPIKIRYPISYIRIPVGTPSVTDPEYAAEIRALIESLQEDLTKEEVSYEDYEYNLSAWAIFTAYVTTKTGIWRYPILKVAEDGTKTEVGSFDMKETSFSKVTPEELAHPSHAGHYQYGHGHGDGTNAGGGIIVAD